MNEMLSPAAYNGDGIGISVKFIGLNDDSYDELAIAIEDRNFIKVSRNETIPFMSTVAQFSDLENGKIYNIKGRVIQNGEEKIVESSMIGKKTVEKTNKPNLMRGGAMFNKVVGR